MASAIVKKSASITNYTDEATKDPMINSLTDKLFAEIDPAFTAGTIEPARVIVTLNNGRELTRQVDIPLGTTMRPFTAADVRNKLNNNNSVSIKPFSDKQLDKLISTVNRLEELKDVTELVSRLV